MQISSEKEQVGNAFGSQFPLVIVILLVTASALYSMYGSTQYRYQRRSEATAMHAIEPQNLATPFFFFFFF